VCGRPTRSSRCAAGSRLPPTASSSTSAPADGGTAGGSRGHASELSGIRRMPLSAVGHAPALGWALRSASCRVRSR
jgi:hypothetical protein